MYIRIHCKRGNIMSSIYDSMIFLSDYVEEKQYYKVNYRVNMNKEILNSICKFKIESLFLNPDEFNIQKAKDYIVHLERILDDTKTEDNIHNFILELLEKCKLYPESVVRVLI